MSDTENNSWTHLEGPTSVEADDNSDSAWPILLMKFGESGEPGFDDSVTSLVRSPGAFGHNNSVMVNWTTYRSETGELLAIHANYAIDESDPDFDKIKERPYMLMVNPSHRRKGIGSIVGQFVYDRYVDKHGGPPNTDALYHDVPMSTIGAAWLNDFWTT
ncbi:MAG: hypothetical protein FJX80_05290 [Bacteroidetes bacterium]|nr:hypothetical protein [Bacteroidota bacterium]